MSKTNSLRCPLCGKGRIADIPSGAEQSQYRLFALHRAEHPDLIAKCPKCGGRVKPDVVLYEEGLDNLTVSGALDAIRRADLLIVAGTSLTVYPAAAFLDEYPGNRLVLINKTVTPRDDIANLALHEKLGEVFQNL